MNKSKILLHKNITYFFSPLQIKASEGVTGGEKMFLMELRKRLREPQCVELVCNWTPTYKTLGCSLTQESPPTLLLVALKKTPKGPQP